MGICVHVAREAEMSLLLIRAFYSKIKTGMLKGYLAGNDKGKDLGWHEKAHIPRMPNSLFPTKPSHFFLQGFLHEEVKHNSWLNIDFLYYCLGCFFWLLSSSLVL